MPCSESYIIIPPPLCYSVDCIKQYAIKGTIFIQKYMPTTLLFITIPDIFNIKMYRMLIFNGQPHV